MNSIYTDCTGQINVAKYAVVGYRLNYLGPSQTLEKPSWSKKTTVDSKKPDDLNLQCFQIRIIPGSV